MSILSEEADALTPENPLVSGPKKRPVYALVSLGSVCLTAVAVAFVMRVLTAGGMGPVIGGVLLSIAVASVGYVVSLVTAILSVDREENPRWVAGAALGVQAALVCAGVVWMAID